METNDDIDQIFQIVDSDGSGYLNKEKLQLVCPHLSSTEIDLIFDDLDKDHDNRISLKEFTHGFQQLIVPHQNQVSLTKKKLINSDNFLEKDNEDLTVNMTQTQINEVFNHLSCQEQIYEFYETLRHGSSESTEQFQSILEVFIGDIMKYRKEIKRLEDSFRRDKEINENYLKRIEEDQEREMRLLEERIRREDRQKFEAERELQQQRTSKQIADLQSNVQRLQAIEQFYRDRQSNEDASIVALREEISKLTQENQTLNSSLNDSLTTIAILRSDIQSLKTQLSERQTMLLQEKQVLSNNYREKEALQANVRQLVEVNKTLRDECDSLRAKIESTKPNGSPSDLSLVQKRSMSRTGSILENYWSNPKIDHYSSNYLHNVNTFDPESTDELGTEHVRTSSKLDSSSHKSSLKYLPSTTSIVSSNDQQFSHHSERNNTMNDSGLSLTTVRDATEVESDRETKSNRTNLLRNSKPYRSTPIKRTNHNSDSDDVFDENPFDRHNSKRWSQQRSSKRSSTNGRCSSKHSTNQLAQKQSGTTTTSENQPDPLSANLPFDRMYKVVFCGDAAVGKSTLIMRLCKGKFISNVNSTLGVDFQNKQLELDAKRIAIQLWDTAGQERFRSIAKSYFRRCDGVILVYDTTYERSFLNVREWIDTIAESTSKKVSVMIVANKIDLRDQLRAEGKRVIETEDGAKLAKEYQALFIETSAKEGTNSNESLIELARDMQCNEDLERYRTAGIDLDKTTKKSTCCGSRS